MSTKDLKLAKVVSSIVTTYSSWRIWEILAQTCSIHKPIIDLYSSSAVISQHYSMYGCKLAVKSTSISLEALFKFTHTPNYIECTYICVKLINLQAQPLLHWLEKSVSLSLREQCTVFKVEQRKTDIGRYLLMQYINTCLGNVSRLILSGPLGCFLGTTCYTNKQTNF